MGIFSNRKKRIKRVSLELNGIEARGGIKRILKGYRLTNTLILLLFALLHILVITVGNEKYFSWLELAGGAILILAINALMGLYISKFQKSILKSAKDLLLFELIGLFLLVVARLIIMLDQPKYLIPIAVFSMIVAIAYSQRFAIVFTVLSSILIGMIGVIENVARSPFERVVTVSSEEREIGSLHLRKDIQRLPKTGLVQLMGKALKGKWYDTWRSKKLGLDLSLILTLMVGGVIAVLSITKIPNRDRLFKAGHYTGIAFSAVILATYLFLGGKEQDILSLLKVYRPKPIHLDLIFGYLNGICSGYIVLVLGLPFIERAFHVVTDIRLRQLSDLNHPFLKKFSLEAPGTFHHSQVVGSLAEAAAEAIGANALLTRVGAYFHDIGKILKPEYFTENIVSGQSKHSKLTPTMSTLIIIAHTKDGVEIGKELGLPSRIIDFIREHHGTSAVEYFFREALKKRKRGEEALSKDVFRYPGPKPRSKETAIVLLADAVEAISRTLAEPTPARIESLVHEVVMDRLMEKQLDESNVTITDLHKIEESFTRVLLGIFHSRIKYPKKQRKSRRQGSPKVVAKEERPQP
jgi:putative nucleotidyltransferase with HDIG domain